MLAASLALVAVGSTAVQAPSWQIDSTGTLMWEGEAYRPIGLRIDGTPDAIRQAYESGVEDVLIDLPPNGVGWEDALEALNETGLRYFVTITGMTRPARGYAIEPGAFRYAPVEGEIDLTLPLFSADDALLLLVEQRSSSIEWQSRRPVQNGRLDLQLSPAADVPHTLLVYPRVSDLRTVDWWDGFDDHRDDLLAALRRNELGPGFRGLINPLGAFASFPEPDDTFVPDSALFRLELANYLRVNYSSLELALRAWQLGANEIRSYEQLAGLIPLWSGSRGVERFWDPSSDRLITADRDASLAWSDIRSVIRQTSLRRYARFVSAIRSAIDAPVLQEWSGWNGPYEGTMLLDGIGFDADASQLDALLEDASRPISTALRRRFPGLLLATDVRPAPSTNPFAPQLTEIVTELQSAGVRGTFFRTADAGQRESIAQLSSLRRLDTSASPELPQAIYYPEAARDPASPGRLGEGLWWLPAPWAGERLELGSDISGYRVATAEDSFVALWSDGQPQDVDFRVLDPEGVTLTDLDGQPVDFRRGRNGVTLPLGRTPVLLRPGGAIPIPLQAFEDTSRMIRSALASNDRRLQDAGDQRFLFEDALRAFDRSPAGSFLTMRAQLDALVKVLAPYTWIEGEAPQDTNFSDIVPIAGSSSGQVLTLDLQMPVEGDLRYADYDIQPNGVGPHELWVAGKLPEALNVPLRIRVGGELLDAAAPPYSRYGDGLAWYLLGEVNLSGGSVRMSVEVLSDEPTEIVVDAIVLSPSNFRPEGSRPPMRWLDELSRMD